MNIFYFVAKILACSEKETPPVFLKNDSFKNAMPL